MILVVARRCFNRPSGILVCRLIMILVLSRTLFDKPPDTGSIVGFGIFNITVCVSSERMCPPRVRPGRAGKDGEDGNGL
jgi:hypothetical protein